MDWMKRILVLAAGLCFVSLLVKTLLVLTVGTTPHDPLVLEAQDRDGRWIALDPNDTILLRCLAGEIAKQAKTCRGQDR